MRQSASMSWLRALRAGIHEGRRQQPANGPLQIGLVQPGSPPTCGSGVYPPSFANTAAGRAFTKPWAFAGVDRSYTQGLSPSGQARLSCFIKGFQEWMRCPAPNSSQEACMGPAGKVWILSFKLLKKACHVLLAHPVCTQPDRGNKIKPTRIGERFPYGRRSPSLAPPSTSDSCRTSGAAGSNGAPGSSPANASGTAVCRRPVHLAEELGSIGM